jgi:succinate dehydrogenase flavin-adding protein (antitoxin of CptAB toxin-antitoxin module)
MPAAECIIGPSHSIHLHIDIPELKEKEIRDLIDLMGSNDPDIIAILEKSTAKYIINEF